MMIKFVIAALFSASMLTAQTSTEEVKIGDVFEIGRPAASNYKHIDLPRPNLIIKKGGIANYKKVEGNTVIVTSVKEKKDGTIKIKLKRTDGTRFFGTHPIVSADFTEAMSSKELLDK